MSDTTRALTAGLLALIVVVGHSTLSGSAAVAFPEYRNDQPVEATTTTLPAPTTTTAPQPPPTTTTTTVATVVQVEQAPPPAPAWAPSSECSRIRVRVRPEVMRWCGYTAEALYEGVRRGAWTWDEGDLSRFMALFSCESNGNPKAKNPRSTASGIGQFLNTTWAKWAPRAASFYGFDDPQVFMPYDNILTTIYLAKTDSFEHWQCWKRYE